MPTRELMSIGVFAQRSGLTASALRFYADTGLLPPAEVDPGTGYRSYGEDQLERAGLLRRLREIGLPLPSVTEVLSGRADAVQLIEEHVRQVHHDAENAQRQAALVIGLLAGATGSELMTLNGPVFAAAIDQVLAASGRDPGLPELNAVRLESSADGVTLTATDRYRLSTRTLVPIEPAGAWAATVDADDLRSALPSLRSQSRVAVHAGERSLTLAGHVCRLLPGEYPDHRALLEALPEVRTRVVVGKSALLAALEALPGEEVEIQAGPESFAVQGSPVAAVITGPALSMSFRLVTLYPAVSTAIGADLLLELRAPHLPMTVRSADHGDLTTLAMPVQAQKNG